MKTRNSVVSVVAVMVLLAGCGATATGTVAGPTAASTATATATLAPPPTPFPTVSGVVAACFGSGVSSSQVTQSGDFLFSPVTPDRLAYPAVMVPDGTLANKPYKLTAEGPDAYSADFPNSPVTNPSLIELGGGGFVVSICDISTTRPHVLNGVYAKITGSTSYTGNLNSWQACDGTMDSHHNLGGGGCGGGMAGCDCFHAAFPSTSAGTRVLMTQTQASLNSPGDNLGKLPFTLKPGKSVTLSLGMDTPPAGIYTFAFGFGFDGNSPIFAGASPSTLLAPVAHKWTGSACQQPSLEAQITPTNPETYYICAQ